MHACAYVYVRTYVRMCPVMCGRYIGVYLHTLTTPLYPSRLPPFPSTLPHHFHRFLSPSVAVLIAPPDVFHPTTDTLSQMFTIQVTVHDCTVLHQALLDAPIRCMTVKGVELTLLDVFPHFGMKMDGTHVKLAEPPPPKKERTGDSQDLVSPVEETGRSLVTVSSRTIHDIQSLIFKLVISADSTVETEALHNGLVIPYTHNLSITVTLKDVHMRSLKKFVNTSDKAYTIHPWGATLSVCEKSSMVVFWDELQALWNQYRVSEYIPLWKAKHCVWTLLT